jgi:hypothetical protein
MITIFTDAPRHLVPMLVDWELCLVVFTMYSVALELNIIRFLIFFCATRNKSDESPMNPTTDRGRRKPSKMPAY